MCSDKPISESDPLAKLKIEMFDASLDNIHTQLNERFAVKQNGVFRDISLLIKKRIEEVIENKFEISKDSFDVSLATYGNFLNEDIKEEYVEFCKCFQKLEKNLKLSDELHPNETDHNSDLNLIANIGDVDNSDVDVDDDENEEEKENDENEDEKGKRRRTKKFGKCETCIRYILLK